MDIVGFAIRKPVTITVGVLMIVMFGLIGLGAIPIQLVPDVDRPAVTVSTVWPGRSPEEIIDRITKEQEEFLKGVEDVKRMRSTTNEGSATIVLEFYVGTDIDRALREVSDALRQVPDYPEDVNEPVVTATMGREFSAITWLIIDLPPEARERHPNYDITTLYDALDKEVKPYLERVGGVAKVNIYGGREREVRVLIDPMRLAQRDLRYGDVAQALRAENSNTSAGTIAEGKRDYRVRVVGQYDSADDVLDTVVTYRGGSPVYVRDVADVEIGHEKQRGFVRSMGAPAIAINAERQTGANVMEVMEDLRLRIEEIRADILPGLDPVVGPDLRLRQVYDETEYISSAIGLVLQNLWIGGALAAIVLLLFLRSFISTSVIVLAIPISVIGTFLVLLALGRNLNVISLAGLAFAVGMVVDNAIVVLENIYRRLQGGEAPRVAAQRGGREVWGAILASTLTTVAVFIPALTIQEEVGQLFRDISLAIVAAVTLSLLVSITVIPAACSRWMREPVGAHDKTALAKAWHSGFGVAKVASVLNERIGRVMLWTMTGWRGWTIRPAVIVLMTVASIVGARMLMPPLDYLPAGNQNLVFGFLATPPGYAVDQLRELAERIETQTEPWVIEESLTPEEKDAKIAAMPPVPRWDSPEPFQPVPIDNFFVGAFNGGLFVGGASMIPTRVIPIAQVVNNSMQSIPDSYGFASQSSLFGGGGSGSNAINIEVSGPQIDRVSQAAAMMMDLAFAEFSQVNASPSNFRLSQPEHRLFVTEAGRELGIRPSDIGLAARALFDGAFVGDFRLPGGDTIDIKLLPFGGRLDNFQDLSSVPVATPAGVVVPLDTLVRLEPGLADQEILRIEELPSVTISVTPPVGAPLEQTISQIEEDIIGPVRAAGLIDSSMRINLEGTAAKLTEVKEAMFGAAPSGDRAGWQNVVNIAAFVLAGAGLMLGLYAAVMGFVRKRRDFGYASAGVLLVGVVLAGVLLGVAFQPGLATARLVWALVVTYLLMCALFESFIFPFVIMFSVPLAVVGGFAGLKIAHDLSMANPYVAPQQLDTLTMLGFVILIGVVVNNAILLVHQALNFMRGEKDEFGETEPMPPLQAVAASVRTRIRPIFMSTLTSVGGMTPLVLFPGAGSEMYRGLGSVVIGGLLVSTIFTLVLVPLLFSLVIQMEEGARALFFGSRTYLPPSDLGDGPGSGGDTRPPIERPDRTEEGSDEPVLEPAMARVRPSTA